MFKSKAFVLIFVVVVFILGAILYIYNPDEVEYKNPNGDGQGDTPVACTMEAKLCSDGSYVGRSGPNCEFEACPIPEGAVMEDGTIDATLE